LALELVDGHLCRRDPNELSHAAPSELVERGRLLTDVSVEVVDAGGIVVPCVIVEWFSSRINPDAESAAS
jgi:hypothetical protein